MSVGTRVRVVRGYRERQRGVVIGHLHGLVRVRFEGGATALIFSDNLVRLKGGE